MTWWSAIHNLFYYRSQTQLPRKLSLRSVIREVAYDSIHYFYLYMTILYYLFMYKINLLIDSIYEKTGCYLV